MSPTLSRRQFLGHGSLAVVATLSLTLPGAGLTRRARAAGTAAAPAWDYAFPLLGDIHFDDLAHHDMDWVLREKPRDVRQIENYSRITREFTPRLLARTAELARTAPAPVPFTIQLGDFVEGLCGSYDLQALQFRDAMAAVAAAAMPSPFLITKGNHDITGPGAKEAFDQVLLPWLGGQLNRTLTSANYALEHHGDRFIFFDAYQPDMDWLENTLQTPARHTFFLVHPPVVPYNERANWHLFARPRQAAERERLLRLLGEHRAIVLSGHLHKYNLLQRATEAGPFTQLAINSVIRSELARPRHERDQVTDYGPPLLDLDPNFAPHTLDERQEWLAREAPHIERFEYADLHGLGLVLVRADRIEVVIYGGLATDPWRERSLPASIATRI